MLEPSFPIGSGALCQIRSCTWKAFWILLSCRIFRLRQVFPSQLWVSSSVLEQVSWGAVSSASSLHRLWEFSWQRGDFLFLQLVWIVAAMLRWDSITQNYEVTDYSPVWLCRCQWHSVCLDGQKDDLILSQLLSTNSSIVFAIGVKKQFVPPMHFPILSCVFFSLGSPQISGFCFAKKLFKSRDYYIYTTEVVFSVFCFTWKCMCTQLPLNSADKINCKLYPSNVFLKAVCSFNIQMLYL